MTLAEDKGQARKAALGARKVAHRNTESGTAACAALLAALRPYFGQVLAGYMPIRSEIDPRPAMIAFDGPTCVPVVDAPEQPLSFRHWHAQAPMIPGAFGAAIPVDPAPIVPQVLIVPLVAFTRGGLRLGYGGGFYDRTLQKLRAAAAPVTAIGFAYGAQELPDLPQEPTDQPLDMIITECGIIYP
ncbi:5-formyltetrahydrofolate cyclo-ligase [Thioclava sp. SK-1]|uniref:5-formyltetrahydrofolate cyclo-ligase n=1 Tax=Thioclava sp. SK-1 TaxID=1889770 RepID=UPI000826796B|nr:5-formyltetrahydrofolate cyclo-ligase [Thioclava sp. SK-1]OCX62301.1 5-formyltetrahydrofolate cyclo-ligase [Thioclava sp. SK-1]